MSPMITRSSHREARSATAGLSSTPTTLIPRRSVRQASGCTAAAADLEHVAHAFVDEALNIGAFFSVIVDEAVGETVDDGIEAAGSRPVIRQQALQREFVGQSRRRLAAE